jgi:hypothetical protein
LLSWTRLQTDRSVGISKCYLPDRDSVKREVTLVNMRFFVPKKAPVTT